MDVLVLKKKTHATVSASTKQIALEPLALHSVTTDPFPDRTSVPRPSQNGRNVVESNLRVQGRAIAFIPVADMDGNALEF